METSWITPAPNRDSTVCPGSWGQCPGKPPLSCPLSSASPTCPDAHSLTPGSPGKVTVVCSVTKSHLTWLSSPLFLSKKPKCLGKVHLCCPPHLTFKYSLNVSWPEKWVETLSMSWCGAVPTVLQEGQYLRRRHFVSCFILTFHLDFVFYCICFFFLRQNKHHLLSSTCARLPQSSCKDDNPEDVLSLLCGFQ